MKLFRRANPTDQPESLTRTVLNLALPSVGEQILGTLVNIVNTMLVGHLGASALAAVGLSGTITMIGSTFFMAVATGTTALVAQSVGARDEIRANRVLEQSMLVALVLGLFSVLSVFPFRRQLLVLMGSQGESIEMGVSYMFYLSLSLPFLALLFVGNAALRGSGDTRTPMTVMAGVNLVNVLLSLVLIRGLGPFPELGVTGAGIAAATAQSMGALAVLMVLMRGNNKLHLRRFITRPNRVLLKQLLDIGLPAGGESALMRLSFIAYTRAISSLGTVAYAAYLIAQRVESLNTMPAFGFSVAATTLSGQAIGARDPDRARKSVFACIRVSVMMSLVWASLCAFAPQFMLGLFTNDSEVIALGMGPLRVVAIAQPLMSIAIGLAGGLRGAGDTRSAMVITGIGGWLLRVPVSILSVTVLGWGLTGVQVAMMLDWASRAVLLTWRFRPAQWKRSVDRALGRQAA